MFRKFVLCFLYLSIVFAQTSLFAQNLREKREGGSGAAIAKINKSKSASRFTRAVGRCAESALSMKMFLEYGAVFAAGEEALLPSNCFFQNESEVQKFQKQVNAAAININGVGVRLQPEAMSSFLAARKEAQKTGLDITPAAKDSSSRNYRETVIIWQRRVNSALDHWNAEGKLNAKEAKKIRSMELEKQVAEIMKLERNDIYFGNEFKKTILHTVAVPGYSQHLFLLALDVAQNSNPKVRTILAKHGWFQTVINDMPHFTYLGVNRSELPGRGLKRELIGGREFWVVSAPYKNHAETKNSAGDPIVIHDTAPRVLNVPFVNVPATMSSDVLISTGGESRLRKLSHAYFKASGRKLHITSALRTPYRQALAMYINAERYGIEYVLQTYNDKGAAWAVIRAYQKNRDNSKKAVKKMEEIIRFQVGQNRYLSNHLRDLAFDIRSRGDQKADLTLLIRIVEGMKGEVVVEKDHYHVEFR